MFLSCLFFILAFSLFDDWKKMQAHTEEMAEWEVLKNTEEAGNWTSYETVMAQSGLEDTVIWTVTDTAMLSSYKPMLRLLESPYQDTFRVQLAQVIFQEEFQAWEESATAWSAQIPEISQLALKYPPSDELRPSGTENSRVGGLFCIPNVPERRIKRQRDKMLKMICPFCGALRRQRDTLARQPVQVRLGAAKEEPVRAAAGASAP